MKNAPKFIWKGDLEDDCLLEVPGFLAHAELLCDDVKCRDSCGGKWNEEHWYVCVARRLNPDAPTSKDDEVLFHSGEHVGAITNGDMARAIAEAIIRAALSPVPVRNSRTTEPCQSGA